MDLFQHFQEHFKNNLSIFFPANSHFILAVSGGVDSVVLVDLFAKSKLDFSIAHCNFNLRGEESIRDENFVKSLAAKYSKDILVKHFDTKKYVTENKVSTQVAARELRYNWFKELQTSNFKLQNYLVTAHHCNDNIETVLINFFRGTGIDGLTGIAAYDLVRKIARPLLPFKKNNLSEYASANSLSFVEDSSNASDKYTRNNFRNQVIPLVATHFPQVEENVLSNISKMNEVQMLYSQAVEKHKKNLVEKKDSEFHIPILKLKKIQPQYTILWEIIKGFSFTSNQVNEIIKLLDAHNGSYVQSATHRIINNRNWLIITPLKEEISQNIIFEKNTKKVIFERGNISVCCLPFTVEQQNILEQKNDNKQAIKNEKREAINETATLDIDKIEFPLLLRKWKQGDYFYPLGMDKKQKLSKFFINQKLSIIDKENVWVIESNKKIIWIVGYRIDNRFKITNSTKQLLQLTYLK